MSNIKDLSVAQLREAIEIREQIEMLQTRLAAIGGGPRLGRPPGLKSKISSFGPKRRMSAAGREAIAAAARARWAKYRGEKSGKGKTVKTKAAGKRRFSPAARARLSAAVKARWAKAKASGKTVL